MNFIPKDYQVDAIQWLENRCDAALFSGCGLGKTACVLSALSSLFADGAIRGALIVAPKRVAQLSWPLEIAKWDEFGWMKTADLRTKQGMQAFKDGSAHVYIINYDLLQKLTKEMKTMKRLPVDAVVWDELTRAKNHSSKRIRAFLPHSHRFKYRWGLTGTPSPNSLLELFAQIRLLDGGARFGKSFTGFRQRFFYPTDFMQYNWEPLPGTKEKIQNILADLALVQRSEDHLDIPETNVYDIEVRLLPAVMHSYRKIKKDMLLRMEKGDIVAVNAAVLVNKLLQFTGGQVYDEERREHTFHDQKIKALKTLLQKKRPLLIAANYIHEIDAICKAIPQVQRWDEKTSYTAWNRGEIPALIAHPLSIGHGLNLQHGGSAVCWYSMTWSRELYDQFNARLVRMGQDSITEVYRLVAIDTVDEVVAEVLRSRQSEQNSLLQAIKLLQQ